MYVKHVHNVLVHKDLGVLFGTTLQLGGPIWTEPIHHQEFVSSLLREVKETKEDFKTYDRIVGLLTLVSEVSL